MQKEFPLEPEQLGLALLRPSASRILFISLDLMEVLLNGRFQGQAGRPQVDVSRH